MRTLSGTPKEVTVISKCGGKYIYFGLARAIKQVLLKQPSAKSDELPPQLQINIDGLPLFKCTSDQFWPILGSFGRQEVFLIGLFYGKSKPASLEEYLKDFLEELDVLQDKGHKAWENGINFLLSKIKFKSGKIFRNFIDPNTTTYIPIN